MFIDFVIATKNPGPARSLLLDQGYLVQVDDGAGGTQVIGKRGFKFIPIPNPIRIPDSNPLDEEGEPNPNYQPKYNDTNPPPGSDFKFFLCRLAYGAAKDDTDDFTDAVRDTLDEDQKDDHWYRSKLVRYVRNNGVKQQVNLYTDYDVNGDPSHMSATAFAWRVLVGPDDEPTYFIKDLTHVGRWQ